MIVEVNFKLRPLPFETRSIVVLGERENLLPGAQRVIGSRLFPVAAELLSPELGQDVELCDGRDHVLLLRFAGSASALMQQIDSARELVRDKDGGRPAFMVDDRGLWDSLARSPFRFRQDLVWRVGLRPADVPTFLANFDETSAREGSWRTIWHAGVGDGRVRVVDRLRTDENESGEIGPDTIRRLESFRDLATNLGGTLIIEHAPAEIRDHANTWETNDVARGIEQRIKQQLDPDGIFPQM